MQIRRRNAACRAKNVKALLLYAIVQLLSTPQSIIMLIGLGSSTSKISNITQTFE